MGGATDRTTGAKDRTHGVEALPILGATDGIMRTALEQMAKDQRLQSAQQRLLGPGNRTAVRPKSSEEAGIRRTDARVEVRPGIDDRGGRQEPCIEVAVYSLMRPGLFKRVRVSRYAPTAEVQIAAGACCEGLCEEFGDPFDPSQAAQEAGEKLRLLKNA